MQLIENLLLILLFTNLTLIDMRILQQNRYNLGRYQKWFFKHFRFSLKQIAFCLFVMLFLLCSKLSLKENSHLINTLFLSVVTYVFIKSIEKKDQPLIITKRIQRLLVSIVLFTSISIFTIDWLMDGMSYLLVMLFFMLHSVILGFIAYLNQPIENKIRQLYREKAVEHLMSVDCLRIGITGSYGKTSTKMILNELLSTKYSCCATPKSYNNEMGIARSILEKLHFSHEIFICEMGADHRHEIEDLSRMILPQFGILCAVGPQHLSTFRSIQNILNEKMQLIEALPENGTGFLNVDNKLIREHLGEYKCRIITYGIEQQADYQAVQIGCTSQGSVFVLQHDGKTFNFQTPLLGRHNILNCTGALAVAFEMGIDPVLLQHALARLTTIEHRMQLKAFYGAVLIDNAYNSNPESAKEALEVLAMMEGTHYLITPGFLDLGDAHESFSKQFGRQIANVSDVVILVGRQTYPIRQGLLDASFDEKMIYQSVTMKEALALAASMVKNGDCVLIENDLPELFLN